MKNRTFAIIPLLFTLLIILTACASGVPISTDLAASTNLDAATLVQERCTACHSLDRIIGAHYSAAEWKTVVDHMIANGAQLTPQEESEVVSWLAANYGQ